MKKNHYFLLITWIILFCYSTITALIFQKLLLPLMPSLHAGHGLLNNDAIYFHSVAEKIATNIELYGWSLLTVWPDNPGASGNVSLLGILYYIFNSNDPSIILPVNAAIHAMSGVLMLLIATELWPGKIGKIGGIVSAIIFVTFPSTLNWYAQIHKDGYAIAGTLLAVYSWLRYINVDKSIKNYFSYFIGSMLGICLIIFVRPYNSIFLAVATGLWLFAYFIHIVIYKKWIFLKTYLLPSIFICLIFSLTALTVGISSSSSSNNYDEWSGQKSPADNSLCSNWNWKESSWLSSKLEKPIEMAARTRAGLVCNNYDAASNIDKNILPDNIIDVVRYLPKALLNSVFGPFPNMWLDNMSIVRFVGIFETLVLYLLIPGFFIALRRRLSTPILFCIVFGLTYFSIYGFTIANLGTLHRIRYPYIQLFMLIGILGTIYYLFQSKWLSLEARLSRFSNNITTSVGIGLKNNFIDETKYDAVRKKIMGGGIIVIVLTVITYLGFFIRDVLLARYYGLSDELDAFFIAMLVPMFIVNVFCQSFGASSIPVFMEALKKSEAEGQYMLSNLVMHISKYLFVICVVLALAGPFLLKIIGWSFPEDKYYLSLTLLYAALPLLFFSGVAILGNSILNARMHFSVPAVAQSIVPVFAILGLIVGHDTFGISSVLMGMVIGQLMNILLIEIYLRKESLSLIPSFKTDDSCINNKQLHILIISMIFMQSSVVIDQAMASTLDAGSIAALGLGIKIIFFITGIMSTVIAMVILPYFSHVIANEGSVKARRELSSVLAISISIGILISIFIYIVIPPIITKVFLGGQFVYENANTLTQIVRMGIMQVPFFACYYILARFSTALKNNKPVFMSALIGLLLNILLNYVLMQWIGVSGIALATSLSMLLSAIILLILVHKEGNVGWLDISFIGLSWMLYLTLMLCLYYSSYAGVVASAIPLTIILMVSAGSYKFIEPGFVRANG